MTAPSRPARPGLGIALIVLGALCFGSMDNTTRYVGRVVPVLFVLWARYTFQAVAMTAWLAASSRHGFKAAHPRFQVLRGLLLLVTSALSFYGVQHMPVAEFTAINLLTPVIVTLLAARLLHERLSLLRWALVIGGFGGALIVIRPGSGLFGWAVLFPLAGAFSYASFQVLTSKLAALESPYTTHFYTGLVGTAVLTPLLLAAGVDVPALLRHTPGSALGLLLLIGALGTVGHLLLILALGLAPTATLMPFAYAQIVAAAAVGWLVFRAVPDAWGWVGMGVIAACGGTSAWLNLRAAGTRADARPIGSAVALDTIAD